MVKEENTLINIAICDDDLVFASKIEAMLLQISKKQMIKMNIEVFSDGSELWDDIAFGKNKYELLYLDIEMVRINGIEVARKIRENDADAILIYISAYDNYFISETAYKEMSMMPFENIMVPVPVGYDEILRAKYGENYMVPANIGGGHNYPFYKKQEDFLIKNNLR